jgi:flagellar biosynthesis/type III secretory pathway protein FliH
LRELLPGIEFQQAITVVEAIAAKTEDRMMYDQRLKAQRDYQWGLDSARKEGMEEGMEKGMEEGMEKGMEKGREEGRKEGELLGTIRILQELLGDEPSSPESLDELTIGELSEILADLQLRLRSRES